MCKLCSVGELNKRLNCKCSSKASIYTRIGQQKDNNDNVQLPR